jgi:double-stranded uracil-DNA glycosylase
VLAARRVRGLQEKAPASRGRVHSFAAIECRDAELLILGSMPGAASLAAGRYYANPHNHFWRIMGDVLGMDAAATYDERIAALVASRIALWDVLHSCEREGSLDTNIRHTTQAVNDFEAFFRTHSQVRRVLLNGAKAYDTFRRHVALENSGSALDLVRLPSTSPANASWSYERKLEAWRGAVVNRR